MQVRKTIKFDETRKNMDNLTTPLLLVALIGLALTIAVIFLFINYPEKDESYYAKIESLSQSGYTMYIDGSVIDFDKIIIRDYPTEKIHINNELKEIYISK